MRINLCVPTRGKSDYLAEFVGETVQNMRMPGSRVVIGFDNDDETPVVTPISPRIVRSFEDREDSLGAKYNRCAAAYDADLYVMGLDDVAISTPGWDTHLAEAASVFRDGIGCVYFGQEPHGESLPSMQAVTRRMVDLMGFFVVPHYPFWWGNTTLDEIARLIGRVVHSGIQTRYPTKFNKPERRDILYWARFFDETRPFRVGIADRIIEQMDDGPTRKAILESARPALLHMFQRRNARLRDPAYAGRVEAGLSTAVPLDDRHARLRQAAEEFLNER